MLVRQVTRAYHTPCTPREFTALPAPDNTWKISFQGRDSKID